MDNQHRQIKGYRDLSQMEIDAMNALKAKAEEVRELLDTIAAIPGVDGRWLSIGRTDLQKGFMAAIRGVARPETF
ncbi:hypothetical protein TSH7_10000 [Azospirillum sp. TSH7]|uniref:Acb2/Tad1 domain-containing protein n=1 Tax=unclassified Azospirillum TaxID=2630922 RepID=UPI000D61F733|nr:MULTISPECIES: hypothetical protein [unclassified Azospirillum]PWC64000.1 hypothetical protein TSH20_19095 [Azospirillum sp. TSH20]PWC64863.1 hypothetical protein TSH7_10000 [Azospirillum sp. TSH7]